MERQLIAHCCGVAACWAAKAVDSRGCFGVFARPVLAPVGPPLLCALPSCWCLERHPPGTHLLALSQNARDYRYGNPPIRVRPASSQEGAAYLAQPAFSSCTVPIIW